MEFPAEDIQFKAQPGQVVDRRANRQSIITTAADWEMEFANDDDDDDAREPVGIIFLNVEPKVISMDFYEGETMGEVKDRFALVTDVSPASLSFKDYQKATIPDNEPAATYSSLTLDVHSTERSTEEMAMSYQKLQAGEQRQQQVNRRADSGPSGNSQGMSANQVLGKLASEVPGYKVRRAQTVAFPSSSVVQAGSGNGLAPPKPARYDNLFC